VSFASSEAVDRPIGRHGYLFASANSESLVKFLSYDVEGAAKVPLVGGFNGGLYASMREKAQKSRLHVLIVSSVENPATAIKGVPVVYTSVPPVVGDEFRKQCGTHYVRALHRSAHAFIWLDFGFDDYEVIAALGVSGGASLQQGPIELSSHSQLNTVLTRRAMTGTLNYSIESVGLASTPKTALIEAEIKKGMSSGFPSDFFGAALATLGAATENVHVNSATTVELAEYPDVRPLPTINERFLAVMTDFVAVAERMQLYQDALRGKAEVYGHLAQRLPFVRARIETAHNSLADFRARLLTHHQCLVLNVASPSKCPNADPVYVPADYYLPKLPKMLVQLAVIQNGAALDEQRREALLKIDPFKSGPLPGSLLRVTLSKTYTDGPDVLQPRLVSATLNFYEEKFAAFSPSGETFVASYDIDAFWKRARTLWDNNMKQRDPNEKTGKGVIICAKDDHGLTWIGAIGGIGREYGPASTKGDYYYRGEPTLSAFSTGQCQ
jgi:hypothetical protein